MRQGNQEEYWKTINSPEFQQLKADANRYIEAGSYLKKRAEELLNIGNDTANTTANSVSAAAKKSEKDILTEEYELQKAKLELSKEQNNVDTEGVKYYEKLLILLTEYRDKMK